MLILFFRATEELTEHISHHSSKVSNDSELTADLCISPNKPETPADTEHLQEKEKGEIVGQGGERDSNETERVENVRESEVRSRRGDGEEREKEGECDQMWKSEETEMKELERHFNERETKEVNEEFGENGGTESGNENAEIAEEIEYGVEKLITDFNEDDLEEREEGGSHDVTGVERSIQVMDGHISLGSVQWRDSRHKAVGRLQVKNTKVPSCN